MRRRTALLCIAVLTVLAAPPVGAAVARKPPAVKAPVVAVIDTGVRATHREFDYRGPASTVDQFVGWWDFTGERKGGRYLHPRAGQLWDTSVRHPYDSHGHGTLTASMVGGRGATRLKTPAAAPGTKLAIAKVGERDGDDAVITGDLAAAIRWATRTVRADVISISIGSIIPVPADVFRDSYDAVAEARRAGVLVVVANGNGFYNAGIPGDPGWANWFSSSPHVLAVGASDANQYFVSTDPEVTAVFTVVGASHRSNSTYVRASGTSFGTPYVAGFAAALVKAAREARRPLSVGRLEQLLKYSARDTITPPTFEGYGMLSAAQLPAALRYARAGTLPKPNSTNQLYVDSAAGTLRAVWTAA